MAGSFGFEADKYDVSQSCGERALFPAVRQAGMATVIVADGFSCREQIAQSTGRHALHLAEVIQIAQQQDGRYLYPEGELESRRRKAQRRSRVRTLVALAGAVVGGLLLRKVFER